MPNISKIKDDDTGTIYDIEDTVARNMAGGLSSAVKAALLDCFENVAWINDDGQTYYDALYDALYPPANLLSISAVYTQSGTVYDNDSLDSLKTDLVITAYYTNGTSETVTTYTLSGTLTEGTSIVTVAYGGKTTTFTVTVTHRQVSGDDVWYDGSAYENLTIVANEYVRASDGQFVSYSGWSRTGFVYCGGASSITFPKLTGGSGTSQSTAFYSSNSSSSQISRFTLSRTEDVTITVPSNAQYFAISEVTSVLEQCVADGIIPHA